MRHDDPKVPAISGQIKITHKNTTIMIKKRLTNVKQPIQNE